MASSLCGIAHDLGSVITVIRGSADLARNKLEPDDSAQPDITRIVAMCEEAASLVMALRAQVCPPAASDSEPLGVS